jgi:hypothetical protein
MIFLGLLLLSPIRFEYMVSTLGLRYTDALARVAAGVAGSLAARFISVHVRRRLSHNSLQCASTPVDPRDKLKAA